MKKILGSNPLDTYEIATGQVPEEGDLAVIDATGKIVEADDATGVKTVGVIEGIDADGKVYAESCIVLRKNSENAALTRADRGAKCYVEDGQIVAKTGTVVAGIVVDVTSQGVFVNTDPVAVGQALGAHIADVAAVTQDTLTGSLTGTLDLALADMPYNSTWSQTQADTVNKNFKEVQAQLAKAKADNAAQVTKMNVILAALEAQGISKTA